MSVHRKRLHAGRSRFAWFFVSFALGPWLLVHGSCLYIYIYIFALAERSGWDLRVRPAAPAGIWQFGNLRIWKCTNEVTCYN